MIESGVKTEGDRTGYNVETKENGMKKCLHIVETKEIDIVKEMHKSYADKVHGEEMVLREDRNMPQPKIRK